MLAIFWTFDLFDVWPFGQLQMMTMMMNDNDYGCSPVLTVGKSHEREY